MKLKKRLCAAVLACAVAVSALSIGFASWATTVSATGDISASGSWDVSLTDASLTVSSVGAVIHNEAEYQLVRTGKKTDAAIASSITATTRTDDWSLVGTQLPDSIAGHGLSTLTSIYFVDTTVVDLSTITGSSQTLGQSIVQEESTVPIFYTKNDGKQEQNLDMNKFYTIDSSKYTSDEVAQANALVIDGLLRDSVAALKEMYPDTYQNYALVHLRSTKYMTDTANYVIATMEKVDGSDAVVQTTDTAAAFADVSFSLPGAWAEYSLTVTNNGTADANLGDAVIALTGENTDQLRLDAPDLTGDILKSGESCTITVVVEALDDGSNTLDASGTLTITLPYSQAVVEDAPSASHTH